MIWRPASRAAREALTCAVIARVAPGCPVAQQRRRAQIDRLTGRERLEHRVRHRIETRQAVAVAHEPPAPVAEFGAPGAHRLGAVPDPGIRRTAKARAPGRRGVAERRVEEVVQPCAARRARRLGRLEDRLEDFLLGKVLDQRARRRDVLRLYRAPQRQPRRMRLRSDRARRPGSGRHRTVPRR